MVDDLIERIAEESGEDEDAIRERIEAKVEEMSGLVSEEGAAHLIAREAGVELAEAEEQEMKVEHVVPGMSRMDITVKVTDKTDTNTFTRDDGEDGKVRNLVLGDETGTVRMSLWDDQVEIADKVDVGDVIHITGAYTREDNRGNPELRIGRNTHIERVDEEIESVSSSGGGGSGGGSYQDVNIDEVIDENVNYAVAGTVVELYTQSPFYKACPECQKKVEEKGDGHECKEHGPVEPNHNLILSAIIDDGYDNVRTVFFRDRAKELLQAEDEEFDGDVEQVKEHARKVKGQNVTVKGQSRYNDYFNRIELIGDEVAFTEPRTLIEERLAEMTTNA